MNNFKKLYLSIVIAVITFESSISFAQFNNIKFVTGAYTFQTKYDSINYATQLRVKKNKKIIYKEIFPDRITDIKEFDLDNDGKKEILINMFSGGAHCCTNLYAGKIINNKFQFTDSILWGNSFYEIEDLNKDKKFQVLGMNDMFAYAFTNYAQSQFNILIFGYANNKFVNVTKNFPKLIEEEISKMTEELKQFQGPEFKCPELNEDTFNTDAGAVKAILAVIVADYSTLGEIQKGYDIVNEIYKCPDKEKFIQTLENDFKLK